ncbi:MAG TPA: LPS export ABC transporter periplasmic protein LptC [Chitinophagaceae bacterium]|nr:LPS export ABC transporter periplasmic protein LptC [Chitinophagaceae bacterium]
MISFCNNNKFRCKFTLSEAKGLVQLSIRYSALLALLFFSSCENDPKEIENWTKRTELREEAKTIESYLSQSGVMKAKLTAPLMYRYQRDTVFTEFPNTLNVEFYDDSVRVESWLTAKYGIYYDNLNKVFLRDSVVVINKEGDTLRTPELWWDQNMQKFYTNKPSRIDGKDKHIYCRDGIDAPQDMKVFTCHFPTGPFNLKEGIMTQ